MTRPNFLTTPGVWLRTPRTIQSAVDQACAVEHNVPPSTTERVAGVVLAVVIGIVMAALLWHWAAQ